MCVYTHVYSVTLTGKGPRSPYVRKNSDSELCLVQYLQKLIETRIWS